MTMCSTLMHVKTFAVYVMEMAVLLLSSVTLLLGTLALLPGILALLLGILALLLGIVMKVSLLSNIVSQEAINDIFIGYVDVGVIPVGARDIRIMETSPSAIIGVYNN